MQQLIEKLTDKLSNRTTTVKTLRVTQPKEFNLTVPKPRALPPPSPAPLPVLPKRQPVSWCTFSKTLNIMYSCAQNLGRGVNNLFKAIIENLQPLTD